MNSDHGYDWHAYNKHLYDIDVIVFGELKANEFWQHRLSEPFVWSVGKPLWFSYVEYQRNPKAPEQPSLDWHESPHWANYLISFHGKFCNWSQAPNTYNEYEKVEPRPPQQWFYFTYPDYVGRKNSLESRPDSTEKVEDGMLTGTSAIRAVADAIDANEKPSVFQFYDPDDDEWVDCKLWSTPLLALTIRRTPEQ